MHQLQRTVIARSEATWQSPGTNSKKRCTKGEVRAKMAPSTSRCAFRYIIPGDCHGPKGPRNDTVTVTQVRSRYCAKQQFTLPNFLSLFAGKSQLKPVFWVLRWLIAAAPTGEGCNRWQILRACCVIAQQTHRFVQQPFHSG